MRLMRFGHMFIDRGMCPAAGATHMACLALVVVQAFHRPDRHPQIDHLADKRMRYAVIVAFVFDVIVDIDPRLLPLGVFVAMGR